MFKNLNPSALGVTGHQSEIIELALTYHFAGMDLNISEYAARVKLKGMAYAKRFIESAKIRVGTFALPVDLESDDAAFQKDLQKVSEYAGCAAEIGCTRCTVLVAPAGDVRPYHENFEFYRRRLHDVCEALKPSGVRLAVGFRASESLRQNRTFQFIFNLDALSMLLNMVAMPNIGVLLDVWDLVLGGGSIESVRKLPIEQIVAVQVAEMPPDAPLAELDEKTGRLLPGGDNPRIDVTAYLDLLKQMGYDGPVTARPSRNAFQTRRRDQVVKQTSEALNKVLRIAAASGPHPAVVATAAARVEE